MRPCSTDQRMVYYASMIEDSEQERLLFITKSIDFNTLLLLCLFFVSFYTPLKN